MRPHIEPIHVDDLVWHRAELPHGHGTVRQQNLSYDEENGAASTRVRFDSDWHRPGGWHVADTEWYILAGSVSLGDRVLGPNDYWRAPAGLRVPDIRVAEGSEVLVFREFGGELFTVSGSDRDAFIRKGGSTRSQQPGELTVTLAANASWNLNNLFPGHEEQRKLELAVLYQDFGDDPEHPTVGWFTNLVRVPPHKVGTLIEHHQIAEEAYNLVGMMSYNYGDFPPGAYFYRPAHLRHAYLSDTGGIGYTFLMRIMGHLKNWHSEDVRFDTGGTALNYDPNDPRQRPVIAGVPVRSRSTGVWDGRGR